MLPARDLLQLPLLGHGASMLGRTLQAVAEASEAAIDSHRLRKMNRSGLAARAYTVLIGDLEASDDWMPGAQRLAQLGRIGLVLVERGPPSPPPSRESLRVFHTFVHAFHLGPRQLEALVSP
jgi:hypothetical protein